MSARGMNLTGVSQTTDEKNPCAEESRLSFKCLDDNAYVRSKCKLEFENYTACKTFWMRVKYVQYTLLYALNVSNLSGLNAT